MKACFALMMRVMPMMGTVLYCLKMESLIYDWESNDEACLYLRFAQQNDILNHVGEWRSISERDI
ncbi:MAG: hypothetical protein ACLRQF_09635 [Thomasclavelia ramosa]